MDAQIALETARLIVEEMAEKVESPEPNRLDFYMKDTRNLIAAVVGLRVKRLGYLAAITGLDPSADEEMLEVLYHFSTGYATITLRVSVPKSAASIPTLTQIIPGAEPFERELSEMFGVNVSDLRVPHHLYLPDDWEDGIYPLRKDFQSQLQTEQGQNKV